MTETDLIDRRERLARKLEKLLVVTSDAPDVNED